MLEHPDIFRFTNAFCELGVVLGIFLIVYQQKAHLCNHGVLLQKNKIFLRKSLPKFAFALCTRRHANRIAIRQAAL